MKKKKKNTNKLLRNAEVRCVGQNKIDEWFMEKKKKTRTVKPKVSFSA